MAVIGLAAGFLNLNFSERTLNLGEPLAVLLNQLNLFKFEDLVIVGLLVDLLSLAAVALFKC